MVRRVQARDWRFGRRQKDLNGAVLVQRPDPVIDFVDRQVAAGSVASKADVIIEIIEAACRYAADLILGGPRAATPRSPTASPVAVLLH
jgi:hypothetical protein